MDIASNQFKNIINNGADGIIFKNDDNTVTKVCINVTNVENSETVTHKYVVPTLSITKENNNLIEKMPFYPLGTVEDYKQDWTHDQVITVLEQLTQAVHYIHSQGIEHRDIKPSNILLESKDDIHIRLGDFSRAKKDANTFSNTMSVGTFNYMAPEANAFMPTKNSDWYSVGATLADLVTKGKCFNQTNVRISEIKMETIPKEFQTIVSILIMQDELERGGYKQTKTHRPS